MYINGACFCIKCKKNVDWQYATPEEENRINLQSPDAAIASAKQISNGKKEYKVEFKCPHCNMINNSIFKMHHEAE